MNVIPIKIGDEEFKIGDKVFYIRARGQQIFRGWIKEFRQECLNDYKLDIGELPKINTYVVIYHGIGGSGDHPLEDEFVLDDEKDFKDSLWFMTKDIKNLRKCVDTFYLKEVERIKNQLDEDYLETVERHKK